VLNAALVYHEQIALDELALDELTFANLESEEQDV
jgi:hypothetical protein